MPFPFRAGRPPGVLPLALTCTLLLGACTSPATVDPAPALVPISLVELHFDHVDGSAPVTAQAVPVRGALHAQLLSQVPAALQFRALSSSVFNVGVRGAGGQRYINVTFAVRNADTDGSNPSPVPRSNLTLIPVAVPDSADDTGFRKVFTFSGAPVAAGVARGILPTHAMTFDPLQLSAVPKAGGEDLQVFTEQEVLPGNFSGSPAPATLADLGVTNVFPYGFVVRNPVGSGAAARTLPASPAPDQFDGRVTVSVRMPLLADDAALTPPEGAKRDPFSFNMVFLVVQDPATRVTQSLEEQASGNTAVQDRASLLGATSVNVLPGSTFPAGVPAATTARRVCQVRTGGPASTPAQATYLVNSCP